MILTKEHYDAMVAGGWFVFPIRPFPKSTATQKDQTKWREWRKKADDLVWLARAQRFTLPDCYAVVFLFKGPTDRFGTTHQLKPDTDNLLKSLNDALRPGDDQKIYHTPPWKFWWSEDAICVLPGLESLPPLGIQQNTVS